MQRVWHRELSRFVGDVESGNLTARIDPVLARGESALVERMNAMTRSLVQVFVLPTNGVPTSLTCSRRHKEARLRRHCESPCRSN